MSWLPSAASRYLADRSRGLAHDVVGVIGLGLIGTALVHRLIATGDAPLVFDVKPEAVQGAVAVGAIAAGSSAGLAERCDVVLVCVQTDDQCIAAVCREGGALEGAAPGTCIAVLSTVSPPTVACISSTPRSPAAACSASRRARRR